MNTLWKRTENEIFSQTQCTLSLEFSQSSDLNSIQFLYKIQIKSSSFPFQNELASLVFQKTYLNRNGFVKAVNRATTTVMQSAGAIEKTV